MDNFGEGRKGGEAARDAVVKANAQGDQQVGIVHAHVSGIAAVHSRHRDEAGMIGGHGTQAHQGVDGGAIDDVDHLH